MLDVDPGLSVLPALLQNCCLSVRAIDRDNSRIAANRWFPVEYEDICDLRNPATYDAVICLNTLGHTAAPERIMQGLVHRVHTGGSLLVTFPYCEDHYIESNYELPGASYGAGTGIRCQSFCRKNLDHWCESFGIRIEEQEYWKVFSGDHWTQGKRIYPVQQTAANQPHQLSCVLFRRAV